MADEKEKDPWSFSEEDITESELSDEEEDGDSIVPPRPKIHNTVGAGVFLQGRLEARRTLEMNGNFKGSIECHEALVVGEKGHTEGDILSNLVIIEGKVRGEITPRRCLMIQGQGEFFGELNCQPEVLVLSENATFSSKPIPPKAQDQKMLKPEAGPRQDSKK